MSQHSRPPWRTMPKDEPPAGYRPLLQQPYGRPPYAPRQPGPTTKRLPRIAWIGIGIGVLIVLLIGPHGSGNSGDATTATPYRTTATGAPTSTASLRSIPVIATVTRGATATQGAIPTPRAATTTPAAPPPAPAAPVVTVKESPVNVRQSADPNAPVIGTLDPATDATVLGPDTTGPDGATRWVHVRAGETTGYVRSDLVSAPHAAGA